MWIAATQVLIDSLGMYKINKLIQTNDYVDISNQML